MNKPAPKSIVIVGGGASATLLLAQLSLHLNTHNSSPINIYIVDNSPSFKVGIAYHIEHPSFVLNVAANRMGACPEQPDGFYQWLIDYPALWRKLRPDFNGVELKGSDFVPRMIYGAYLGWIFNQALARAANKNIRIHRIVARVTNIKAIKDSKKIEVKIDTQEALIADAAILATGNVVKNHQHLSSPHIFSSPYSSHFLQQDWSAINDVILVGSGLSMVDAVQYLTQQNYKGKIHIFSRHGFTPLPHAETQTPEAPAFSVNSLTSARNIVRQLREQIATNTRNGIGWQATINVFRIQANAIWLSLPDSEQKKLQRFLPWWNIARHRIPADAHEQLIQLQQKGRLSITKGNIKNAESDGEYFLLNTNNKTLFIKSEKMVICSGYKYEPEHLSNIIGALVKPKAKLQKELINGSFRISNTHPIYALGPSLAGIIFETTAIHEIRSQALQIAVILGTELYN